MPPKGKTSNRAHSNEFAPTKWGSNSAYTPLTVPSGQRCLVRRPGLQRLISDGILGKMDTLTAVVDEKHIKRVEGKDTVDARSLMADEESIKSALELADKVVVHVVVEPKVEPVPDNDDDRQEGVIYVDDIDVEDKFFILNYAIGGSRDVERFRLESQQSLGGVDAQPAVESPTE